MNRILLPMIIVACVMAGMAPTVLAAWNNASQHMQTVMLVR